MRKIQNKKYKIQINKIHKLICAAITMLGFNFIAHANELNINASTQNNTNTRFLIVTGKGEESIATNLATVNLAIEVNANTANAAQKEVAKRANTVVDFLRVQKVDKLKTHNINLAPRYEYDNNKQKLIGYTANNSVSFETTQEKSGLILDEAIRLGATRIDGISFSADKNIVQKAKNSAISKASKDAEQKANAALTALNLSAQQIIHIVIDDAAPVAQQPIMYERALKFAAADASTQSSPVVGGSEAIEAKVTLHIRY